MQKAAQKSESKSARIQGKCKWACVSKPNTKFEPMWSIDVIIEDKDIAKRLKDVGLNVKQDKDGDTILKIKRKVQNKKGEAVKPPTVILADGTNFDGKIGNGSVVDVSFSVYPYKTFNNEGIATWLNKVTILDLIEYEDASVDLDFTEELSDAPF